MKYDYNPRPNRKCQPSSGPFAALRGRVARSGEQARVLTARGGDRFRGAAKVRREARGAPTLPIPALSQD